MKMEDAKKEELKITGMKMKSISGWHENGNGNNSSGLNILPGGVRRKGEGFIDNGKGALFWTSTEKIKGNNWIYFVTFNSNFLFRSNSESELGLSARCIKD